MRQVVLSPGQVFDEALLERTSAFDANALMTATQIVADVRERGDAALREYTQRFDGVDLQTFRVAPEAIEEALASCDPQVSTALQHAARQVRDFHVRQRQQSWFTVRDDGAIVGSKVEPIEAVGIYVPGGRALYPSSVLMNAIPAQVAGVKRIVCATPPTRDGSLDPAILEACRIAGVTEVYSIGGAQAIAALAYGTETIRPVSKITGPGNAYVAAAKKVVSGDVGIDMIAGPSEVCVVADESADPALVAIDLMAQAEHDPLASCYLVCFDEAYAADVLRAIDSHMQQSARAEITRASLDDKGLVVVCPNMDAAIQTVNVIAPEHLELHVAGGMDLLGQVRNAGAIFMGEWTPEAVGDYVAGPNHTLPTGGTARFSSPLSVEDFVKKSSVIQYTPLALANEGEAIMAIAEHEGLWAHAQSVRLRLGMLQDALKVDGAAAPVIDMDAQPADAQADEEVGRAELTDE